MLDFDLPLAFLALPLPLLVWRFAPALQKRAAAVRLPFFERISAGLEPAEGVTSPSFQTAQLALVTVLWLLAITTVARPVWLGPPITRTEAARDIMLAIDISGSMGARDFVDEAEGRVTRMEGVKHVLDRFIADHKDDRIGVIAFGSAAYVLVPFTRDTSAARNLVATLQPGMAGQNTVLGDAMGLAIQSFRQSSVDERLMVIMSDGADTSSRMAPAKAADIAAKNGVTVHTISLGDPAAQQQGERVDMETLQSIAATTDGTFNRAEDENALASIYTGIDALHTVEAKAVSWRPRLQLTPWTSATFVLATILLQGFFRLGGAAGRASAPKIEQEAA